MKYKRIPSGAKRMLTSLPWSFRRSVLADRSLRILCTHHKTGSVLLANILADISDELHVRYFSGNQKELPRNADIWLQIHSKLEPEKLGRDYKGIHVIRNPYQLIVSGYRYHKVCSEKWCVNLDTPTKADGIRYNIGGLTYQEYLNSVDAQEGLSFEIKNRSYNAIMDMYNWRYDDRRFLNVKFEDIISDFDATMHRIFKHLNLAPIAMETLIEIAGRHNVQKWGSDQVRDNPHITNKVGQLYTYQKTLMPEHYSLFKDLFPSDIMPKLGYEEGPS